MWVITGATGFIGSALLWELNERGENNVLICDHVKPSDRGRLLHKRRFTEFTVAEDLFGRMDSLAAGIRGVFHMGACSSTTETNEEYLDRNNVDYSRRIFEFCARQSIPLVYASSAATYGDGRHGFDDGSDPAVYTPLNLYGWSKLKFDIWAAKQTQTPPRWYGLRFFNVYGPNEYHKGEQSSVVHKAFHQIRSTGRLRLFRSHDPRYRDGEQLRDFIYVKDVTRWMWEIMSRSDVRSGIYNMGFGKARTWLDLARAAFASMKRPVDIDWMDIPDHIRGQYQYFTEARMDRLLGEGLSRPEWSLEAGVADYVGRYLSNPDPFL